MYADNDVARLIMALYSSEPVPAMIPSDAFAKVAHHEVERLDIELCDGHIAASLLTPYPPGIPLLVPGERFNNEIVQYLRFARTFNERFPGFETDMHGLTQRTVNSGVRFYVDCIVG
jgi:arginine decarboxylase